MGVVDELVAAADAGDRHYTDAGMHALRASILLARGDATAADIVSERAVDLARASDIQAQSAAFCVRATVAIAVGRRAEAADFASELSAMGPVLVAALCAAFPTLADVAWTFRDLGRESEFAKAVLDADPIKSPWNDAARAIIDGELVRAADTIEAIGHPAAAAYARLRAAEALAKAGKEAEADGQRAQAESFYRRVGATRFLREAELGRAS
jgi:hypothetical protein